MSTSVNFSGGWVYHWRAFRFRKREWRGHLDSVRDFLESWVDAQRAPRPSPVSEAPSTLILIGPSGGYSLPLSFLERYSQIVAYEPDALARTIFERRFPSLAGRISWIQKEYDFRSELSEGAILFCNVLGQISVKNSASFRVALMDRLKGRIWASYHDALSGREIRFRIPSSSTRAREKASTKEMQRWLETRSTRPIEVIEHLAPDWFEASDELQFFYWDWRLTRKRTHLIEGVFKR